MRKFFDRQLAKARRPSGEVDLDLLRDLVVAAYEETDRDRRRTDRSISLMVEKLDQLNRGLERLVEERTAALQEREDELRAQNLLFDAALNNMSQALMMFDAQGRLLVFNENYRQMYRLPNGDVIKPGIHVVELLKYRKRSGTFFGDPDGHAKMTMEHVANGKSLTRILELPDGRSISVVITPMAAGGWVVTHEDTTERRRAEKQIAHMARHDALTDLPNRLLLRDRLAQALADIHDGGSAAVLYLDLDHFKAVNDTLGHHIGDELLKAAANRLRACVRDADTVARVGGDEFAIVHVGGGPSQAAGLARMICEAVRAPYDLHDLHGHAISIDASIGIAIAPHDGTDPDQLLKNADMALYGAKADGRGTYKFFEPAMDARIKARRSLELALRRALANDEFDLHYQPMVSVRDNRIVCCEALLRWRHPERGMVSPVEFIPAAEEIGLILPLGAWVLRKACEAATRWPKDVKVAVNLSAIQIMNQNLVDDVVGALAAAGLPPTRLELEITESALIQNTETALAALHRLRDLGINISLDDFGTGYSSLNYLRSFPLDKIKIDRCFINGLADGDDSVAIVLAIAGLARNLGIKTTAEGVETAQQLQHVRALGCTEMQGYLFSPPRTLEELERTFWPQAAAPVRLRA
ncbi:MAG: putative bifunctional diguanylate cyclase/phosphodiesterase [Xanthobacteraceae bacterium]